MKLFFFSLCFASTLLSDARADLTMVLSPAVQNSERGREIVFSGTLINTGATKLYLNDIAAAVTVGSAADLPLKASSFFSNVPGVLLPGEAYTNSELFRVALTASAPAGDYRGGVTLRGGSGIAANDDLATAPFAVLSPVVDSAASDPSASEFGPDPGSFTITRSGGTDIDLVVPFAMAGTALTGVDFQTLPNSITIPAGSSAATVTLLPIPNNIAQGDRNAQLAIIAADAFNLGTSTTSEVIIHDKPADAWRFAKFGLNANDPAAADAADWDGDGIVNLLEFALDLNPLNGGAAGLPTVARSGNDLTLSFVPNAAAADVSFIVEGSADLLTWSANAAELVPNPTPGSVVTYRYKGAINASPRGFLRLRVFRTDL